MSSEMQLLLEDLCDKHVLLFLEGEAGNNLKVGRLSRVKYPSTTVRFRALFQVYDRITHDDGKVHRIQYIFEARRVVWIALDPMPVDDRPSEQAGALSLEELEKLGLGK